MTAPAPGRRRAAPRPFIVHAIGDSVMQGAGAEFCDQLDTAIPDVIEDTTPSRQFKHAEALVTAAVESKPEGRVFVVALGTNGLVSPITFNALFDIDDRSRFVFVNVKVPQDWESQVNDTLRRGVDRNRNRARLVDWHAIAIASPHFLRSDAFHLNCDGARAYAEAIRAQLAFWASVPA